MQSLTPFFVLTLIFSGGTLFYLARLSDCRDDQSARKWGPDRFQVSDRFFQEGTGHPGDPKESVRDREGRPNVLLVTAVDTARCEMERGSEFAMKGLQNKIDYARLHNYSLWNSVEMLDPKFDNWWIKNHLLKKLMVANPSIEWFLSDTHLLQLTTLPVSLLTSDIDLSLVSAVHWFDIDILVTDMSMRIPWEKYEGYDIVFHAKNRTRVFEDRHWLSINAGVLLIRNTAWSHKFFDAILAMGEKGEVRDSFGRHFNEKLRGRSDACKGCKVFEADDQSSMVYLLSTFPEKWATKTFIDEEIKYHTKYVHLIEKLNQIERGGSDEKLPFTCHFNGCKFCHGHGDPGSERVCFGNFDRFYQ